MSTQNPNQAHWMPRAHRPTYRAWYSIVTWSITLVFCLSFSMIVGCGSGGPTGTKPDSSQNTSAGMTASRDSAKEQIREKLVGVWLGGAYLDEAVLAQKLENLTPEEGEEVLRRAQYFAATMMAIEFKPDGSLENEIEIVPPGGQPQNEQGFGTWQITQVTDDGFVVEIAENRSDGSVTKSQKIYRFYDGENQFAVSIPLEDVLGECNPLIIFERQDITPQGGAMAEAPRGSTPR